MGIQCGWYLSDQVIYINFYNHVTLEEFDAMNRILEEMLMSSWADRVHIIQDESNIKSAPPHFGRLLRENVIARGLVNGCVLSIGKHSEHNVMKFISTAVTTLSNTRYRRFYHRAEAEAYLEAVDPSVDLYQAKRHHLEMTLTRDNFLLSALGSL
ncbi:MAG: hypothetical protein AAFV93_08620 [Chloroflexota bacterium]